MKTTLLVGEGQSGKTEETTDDIKNNSESGVASIASTHAYKLVLSDLQLKLGRKGVSSINPTADKKKMRTLTSKVMKGEDFEKPPVIVGINNVDFWYNSNNFIEACANFNIDLDGYNDEFDCNQLGFKEKRIQVQKDDYLQMVVDRKPFRNFKPISATLIGAVISNMNFDEVKIIRPGEGYNNNFTDNQITDKDLESLRSGKAIRDNILDAIADCQFHSMINVDTSVATHLLIAKLITARGLKTVDGRRIIPMIINQNNKLDYTLADNYQDHSICYIGGNLFARGVTFPHLQNLVIDKPSADITTLNQAVYRIFGYKSYKLGIWGRPEQLSKISTSLSFEKDIRDSGILSECWEDRHKWILDRVFPAGTRVVGQKGNGISQQDENISESPISRFIDLPSDMKHITQLTFQHAGAPPGWAPGKRIGTTRWGNLKNKSDRDQALTMKDVIDNHPQKTWQQLKRGTTELARRYVIPPWEETYVDDAGCSVTDYGMCTHDDDLPEHWYIENRDRPQKILTHHVLSASSVRGKYHLWYNRDLVDRDAIQVTLVKQGTK